MSEEERQNMKEEEFDDKETDNLEVGNETPATDNTTQVYHNSSEITYRNLHSHIAESIEVDPNDIINVEELSHEPLSGNSSSENPEWKVSYEFPSDDESECDSRPAKVYGLFSHANLHTSGYNQYLTTTQIEEQRDIPIEVFDTKEIKKEATDDECAGGTSEARERKRKNGLIILIQNKKKKEIQGSGNSTTEDIIEGTDNTSDGFPDIKDNVKDSSSSENCDWNSTDEEAKQISLMDSGIHYENEFVIGDKSLKVNLEQPFSGSHIPKNKKSVKGSAEKTFFQSSLKDEEFLLIKFSDENNQKFKLPMPTIPEVAESENDEQTAQPEVSKANPLKMKSKAEKRKDKCYVCNVRLGLCAIQCRCGGYYCAKHRYDREHNCTYDYKSLGATEIRKNNPRIIAEKVRKL